MHKAIKGGTAALAAILALSAAPATAAPSKGATTQTDLPVLVDAAADLTANPDRSNESWYLTAHVTAGGHRYAFAAHYISLGNATQGTSTSKVSITDETT